MMVNVGYVLLFGLACASANPISDETDFVSNLLKREFWEQVAKWAPVAGQVAGALGRDVRNLEDEQITKQRDLIDDVVGRDVQSEELLKREFWEQVAKWAPVAGQVAGILGRNVRNPENTNARFIGGESIPKIYGRDEDYAEQRDLIDDVVDRDVQREELLKREFWEQVAKWAPVAEQVAGALGRDVKNVE